MSNFKKVAELTGDDRSNVKEYWKELYGEEYAKAMVTDYKPGGEKKSVEASGKGKLKK